MKTPAVPNRQAAQPQSIPPDRGTFTNLEAKVWAAEQQHAHRPHLATPIVVLVVSPAEADHIALSRILRGPSYRVFSARSAQEAGRLLSRQSVAVVIAECNSGGCCWHDVWDRVEHDTVAPRPKLVVAASAEDDALWAEVINLGAYDVLAKPFEPDEVEWLVTDAWQSFCRDQDLEGTAHASTTQNGRP